MIISIREWARRTVKPGGPLPNAWNWACRASRGTREDPSKFVRGGYLGFTWVYYDHYVEVLIAKKVDAYLSLHQHFTGT